LRFDVFNFVRLLHATEWTDTINILYFNLLLLLLLLLFHCTDFQYKICRGYPLVFSP
jgi:hypothetical protein